MEIFPGKFFWPPFWSFSHTQTSPGSRSSMSICCHHAVQESSNCYRRHFLPGVRKRRAGQSWIGTVSCRPVHQTIPNIIRFEQKRQRGIEVVVIHQSLDHPHERLNRSLPSAATATTMCCTPFFAALSEADISLAIVTSVIVSNSQVEMCNDCDELSVLKREYKEKILPRYYCPAILVGQEVSCAQQA